MSTTAHDDDDDKKKGGPKFDPHKKHKIGTDWKGNPVIMPDDGDSHGHGFWDKVGTGLLSKWFWVSVLVLLLFGWMHPKTMHDIGNSITASLVSLRDWVVCNAIYVVGPIILVLFLIAKSWEYTKKSFKGGGGSTSKAKPH